MNHREAGGESAIRANRRRRVALFVIGFGRCLNPNAVQPLFPLFRQLFHASEIRVDLTVGASPLAVALTAWIVSRDWARSAEKPCIRPAEAGEV